MEGGPTGRPGGGLPHHFNSVADVHALRLEVDFCDCGFSWCSRASNEHTVEQHYSVKYFFKLGKSASKTLEFTKQSYRGDALGRSRVLESIKC